MHNVFYAKSREQILYQIRLNLWDFKGDENSIKDLEENLSGVEDMIDDLEYSIEKSHEVFTENTEYIWESEGEIKRQEKEIEELNARLIELVEIEESMTGELYERKDELEKIQPEIDRIKGEIERIESELYSVNDEQEEVSLFIDKSEESIAEEENRIYGYRNMIAFKTIDVPETEGKIEALRSDLETLERVIGEYDSLMNVDSPMSESHSLYL
jgi:chromosome segregation ATPase